MKMNQKKHNPYYKAKIKDKSIVILSQILLLIAFIILWEVLSKYNIINGFLFSKPSNILELLKKYFVDGTIYRHLGISILETMLGLIIGTSVGLFIAIIIWWFPYAAKVLDPFLIILNALPKTALAPILIIWAGTGIKGITVVAMSISLVLTVITAYNYFQMMEEDKIKMLKSFKATKWQILTKLILPSNIPNIVSIIKINIGMTWVGVIVGEFLVSRAGIGYLIVYGSQVFRMDLVMMGVIVLAVIAFIMYEVVNLIEISFKKKRGIK